MSDMIDGDSFVERTNERSGPAWHGKTKLFYQTDQLVTCEQMVNDAGGAFDIVKAPATVALPDGTSYVVPNQYAVMRSPTALDPQWSCLGMAKEDFVPLGNIDLARMLDRDLSKEWPAETCGIMENGARVFLVLKVGEYNLLEMKDEHNTTYLMVHHDKRPGGGLNFSLSEVRTVCNNTVLMAIESAQLHIKLQQTGDFIARLDSVMDLSSELKKCQQTSRQALEQLAQARVAVEEAERIIKAAYPDPTKPSAVKLAESVGPDAIANLGSRGKWIDTRKGQYEANLARMELYRAESVELYDRICDEFPAIGGTAYAVVQAVTEHADHRKAGKNNGDVIMSRMFGDRAGAKQRALVAAVKVIS